MGEMDGQDEGRTEGQRQRGGCQRCAASLVIQGIAYFICGVQLLFQYGGATYSFLTCLGSFLVMLGVVLTVAGVIICRRSRGVLEQSSNQMEPIISGYLPPPTGAIGQPLIEYQFPYGHQSQVTRAANQPFTNQVMTSSIGYHDPPPSYEAVIAMKQNENSTITSLPASHPSTQNTYHFQEL